MEKIKIEETEKHQYNNPEDIDNIITEEVKTLEKILNNRAAFDIDIISEGGTDYVVVKRKIDNTEFYKTDSPLAKEMLFPREE